MATEHHCLGTSARILPRGWVCVCASWAWQVVQSPREGSKVRSGRRLGPGKVANATSSFPSLTQVWRLKINRWVWHSKKCRVQSPSQGLNNKKSGLSHKAAWVRAGRARDDGNSRLMLTLYPSVNIMACYWNINILIHAATQLIIMNLENVALVLIQTKGFVNQMLQIYFSYKGL